MVKILERKISDDGKTEYLLKEIGSHFVIIKSKFTVGATEADFADKVAEFTDLEKAKESFKK